MVLIFSTCGPLCASTRAQYGGAAAASNRPGACAGWLPGLRQVWQMHRALGWGTRRRSRAKDEVNGPYLVNLRPSVCIAQGTYDVAAAASNRHGIYEGWSPGPRAVCPMHRAFGRGHGVSIQLQRRDDWPLFREVLTPCMYRQGHKRRSGGCFKRIWYVCRAISRAPKGVKDASDLWSDF